MQLLRDNLTVSIIEVCTLLVTVFVALGAALFVLSCGAGSVMYLQMSLQYIMF